PIADGSDLGGSLRNPAGMCNVVGIRPSIGRVADPAASSTYPRLGVSGPMGRTVADTALLMSALAGPHDLDPLSLPENGSIFGSPLPSTTSAKVAWGGDLGLFECDAEVLEICKAAASTVTAVGGSFAEARPDMSTAESVFRVLRGMSYAKTGGLFPEEMQHLVKATVRENIAYGRTLTVADVLEAESRRADLHRTMSSFFDEFDILALPVALVPAFPVEIEYPTEVNGVPMADYLSWMMPVCMITPTGCPAISIPAGFTKEGSPVGLQLIARPGQDRQLLEIASAMEAANPQHHLSPALG
ncbi:MAG: amidase, partial [Verrucomicrobiales bacterium]